MADFHEWLTVRSVSVGAVVAIVVLTVLFAPKASNERQHQLSFHPNNGTFKILQLTDMHLGEAENLDWGPEQDRKTFELLSKVIPMENPDFIVCTGDQLTSNNIDANATSYQNMLGDFLERYQIPYAMIFGNHDWAPLETEFDNGTILYRPAKTTKQQLLRADQQHLHSLSKMGPSNIDGVSNYVLPVIGSSSSSSSTATTKLQIFFLDTGGGHTDESLHQSQLDWLQQQRLPNTDAIIFQHIPLPQMEYSNSTICTGFVGESGVAPIPQQYVFDAYQGDGSIHFVAVGHNHGQSYCCRTEGSMLHLCFGRHSGYGGYGTWDRGAKVYEMKLVESAVQWRSWTRMESGDIEDEYDPYE